MADYGQIGALFREVRKRRGLTLQQVAAGWSVASLSRFERGNLAISADRLHRLQLQLGLTDTDLGEYLGRNSGASEISIRDWMGRIVRADFHSGPRQLIALAEELQASTLPDSWTKKMLLILIDHYVLVKRGLIECLSDSELVVAEHYFLSPGPWVQLDFLFAGKVVPFLPTEYLHRLINHVDGLDVLTMPAMLQVITLQPLVWSVFQAGATANDDVAVDWAYKVSQMYGDQEPDLYKFYINRFMGLVDAEYRTRSDASGAAVEKFLGALYRIDALQATELRRWYRYWHQCEEGLR